jgi:hypothetical protein
VQANPAQEQLASTYAAAAGAAGYGLFSQRGYWRGSKQKIIALALWVSLFFVCTAALAT